MSINELPLETVNVEFICPIGVPFYYSGMELPSDRYVWVEGQEFDPSDSVLLKLFPSGFLPDPRYDFFRVVDKSEPTLVKHEQSVQPLGFVSDPHSHTVESGYQLDSLAYGPYIVGFQNRVNTTTESTVTGRITGTGTKTAPQHMDWHCIMRVK